MAERYEKVKQFTAITTAILLSTSLLTGCGASTTAASNSVQTATEQAAEEPEELVDPLDWTPLAELDTHAVDTDDSVHTARSSSACFPVFRCTLSGT